MKRILLPAALIAGGLGLVAGRAQADTLEDALANAYATNPQLEARRAQGRGVDENVNQALANWRPTVSLSGSVGRGMYQSNSTSPEWQRRDPKTGTVTISQPLFRGGRTVAQTAQAESQVKAERGQLVNVEQTVLLAGATAYLNVLRDEAVLKLNINNEQVLQRQLDATRDRFRVGEITRTDVSQAEARLARTTAARKKSEGDLETSRATFEKVVGKPPQALIEPKPVANLPATREEAIASAQVNNPLVVAAVGTAEAADHNIKLVRGELLPTLSADGTLGRTWRTSTLNSRTETAELLLSLTVPLYEKGAVYSRLRAAKHTAGQSHYSVDDARRTAIESATQSWETLQSARAQIKSILVQISASEVALDGVQREAQVGSRTVLDVLNAEQELLDARVSLVRAQRDEMVAAYQMLSAVGRMTAQGMNLPVETYDPDAHYRAVRGKWIGSSASADADAARGNVKETAAAGR